MSDSSKLIDQANRHWELRQQAILAGDEHRQRDELLEVITQCHAAIRSDMNEGDSYVLLTNALASTRDLAGIGDEQEDFFVEYAAGVIHKWWTLPKKHAITKNYDLGVRLYEQVLESIQKREHCHRSLAEAKMAEYASEYGRHGAFLDNYDRIKSAVLGIAEQAASDNAKAPDSKDERTAAQRTGELARGRFCPSCGNEVSTKARFCYQCGDRLGS
jgi:hypothetical protein